jgi:hypothetical protein
VVGHGVDIGLLAGRKQERRIEVDHYHAIVLALATTNSVQDLVGNVTRDVVEVTSVGMRKDYWSAREFAGRGMSLALKSVWKPSIGISQCLQGSSVSHMTNIDQD